jgi:hypothetical protein
MRRIVGRLGLCVVHSLDEGHRVMSLRATITLWIFAAVFLSGCEGTRVRSADGGGARDAGALADGGALPDGGSNADAGVALDGGGVLDGGTAFDGGANDGGSQKACGSRGTGPCPAGEYCDFVSACGANDSGGVCRTKPAACTTDCPGICGCDGRRYCNACLAHQAGIDDTGERGSCEADGGVRACGGIAGLLCADDEWCDYADCSIFDAAGTCRLRPEVCTDDCPGVCGCDGLLYCNTCVANQTGADTTDDRSCFGDDGGVAGAVCLSDAQCASGSRCCYPCGIPGCEHVCTETDGGACPILE